MDQKGIGLRFEAFIRQLFEMEGFEVSPPKLNNQQDLRFDLLVKSKIGKVAVVEIKLYRSRQTSFPAILQIAATLEFARQNSRADVGIIVIGNKVGGFNKAQFESHFPNIVVYDIDIIAFLVEKHFSLNSVFEEIFKETAAFSERPTPTPTQVDIDDDLSIERRSSTSQAIPTLMQLMGDREGAYICAELHGTPAGAAGAKTFEKTVEKALRYIFSNDLVNWSPQNLTIDKISIFDLIARISSKHDFWSAIVNQFNSRYIVFEFKNYSEKITQGQIYTTEKYLYKAALRSTAIIISRLGADNNALAASRGALREHGKLIINLDIEQLCKMLKLRDNNDDYNDVLVNIVDDMLMRLDR